MGKSCTNLIVLSDPPQFPDRNQSSEQQKITFWWHGLISSQKPLEITKQESKEQPPQGAWQVSVLSRDYKRHEA